MKFITTLILIITFALTFQTFAPINMVDTVHADTTLINPNGASELSILMRDMQQYTNRAKGDVKIGKSPEAYPASFDKVHTAKISEGMSKSDYYKPFGDLYIMSVKNYASSTPENRIETYNNMVSACLACHSQHCPGPVPVIRKMFWEVK